MATCDESPPGKKGLLMTVSLGCLPSVRFNERKSNIPPELSHLRWFKTGKQSYAVELETKNDMRVLQNCHSVFMNELVSVPTDPRYVSEEEALLLN